MKIVICASMSAVEKIIEARQELEKAGHEVIVPSNLEKHEAKLFTAKESTEEKVKDDLIRGYFNKIKSSDAVLVLNFDKNGIKNYVGGNTFLEMGFGHALSKKVYLLNDIPKISYKDEIAAMQPIILHGDLSKIF